MNNSLNILTMNLKTTSTILSASAFALFLTSCESPQEELREDKVLEKADQIEEKADAIRDTAEDRADALEDEADVVREAE